VVDLQANTLSLIYTKNYTQAFITKYNLDSNSFEAAHNITSAVMGVTTPGITPTRIATGPTAGIQLASGRLVAPVWLNETKGVADEYRSAVIYSDDGGQNWLPGGAAPINAPLFGSSSESVVLERGDGSLLMSARTEFGSPSHAFTTSTNGGLTWSMPQLTPEIDPNMTDIKTGIERLENDLYFSGPDGPGRANLKVWRYDGAAGTWQTATQLGLGPAGYSELRRL
jgi:sialidase-1